MKYSIYILLSIILFAKAEIVLGQDDEQSKYSIQFNLGLSRTLHYNQPVSLIQCFEGCIPEEQKSRITPNGNINLYKQFNKKNSFKIGVGASSYKYLENGRSSDGGPEILTPYEIINRWSFFGLSLGYRYMFNSQKKIKLFIENDFVYEIPVEDYSLIKSGLAIQPKVGAILNINDNWRIVGEGFFKSALTIYSKKDFGKDYKPYAYGIQLGVNLKI